MHKKNKVTILRYSPQIKNKMTKDGKQEMIKMYILKDQSKRFNIGIEGITERVRGRKLSTK